MKVIAATVASDPTKYSEAFLGKPNEEYCAWILNPEKWGGSFPVSYASCLGHTTKITLKSYSCWSFGYFLQIMKQLIIQE